MRKFPLPLPLSDFHDRRLIYFNNRTMNNLDDLSRENI